MITIEQSRAARGLLGWTQQNLADAAGLSKTAINNFEKNKSVIKVDSINAIRRAFEGSDVEFIKNNGVRIAEEYTETLSGDLALQLLIEDIKADIEHAKHKDILVLNAQPVHMDITMDLHTAKTPVRFLCAEDVAPKDIDTNQYKHMTGHHSDNTPTVFLYGQKTAIDLFGESQIIIIKSDEAYTAERKRFEMLWQKHSVHNANSAANMGA